MKKTIEIEQETSKNTVKVSAMWHFVAWYLDMLQSTGAIKDEDFAHYYKQLEECVDRKLNLPLENNILNEYVVYELE